MNKKRIFIQSIMIDTLDDEIPAHLFNMLKHRAMAEIDMDCKAKRKGYRKQHP